MKEKIGFIGLGTMGKWMALNMLKAGFPMRVYDINPVPVQFLAGQGAATAKSPADVAAEVDWLFLSLPDTELVEKVVFGENGVALGARPGLVVVDLSTISYIPTLEINRRLKEKGILFADAPVSGMEARAKEARITVMFGGDEGLLQKVRPALALSLHSTDVDLRARLLPNAPRIPIEELVERAEIYARATSYPVQYQWTLIEGVNDNDHEVERIARLLAGKYAVMNFIPFNEVDGLSYRRPSAERIAVMVQALHRRGILAKIRDSAGQEIEGACGQLRARAVKARG